MNKVMFGQSLDLRIVRSFYIQDTTGPVTSLVVLKHEDTVKDAYLES